MFRPINYDALHELAPYEQRLTFFVTTKDLPDDYEYNHANGFGDTDDTNVPSVTGLVATKTEAVDEERTLDPGKPVQINAGAKHPSHQTRRYVNTVRPRSTPDLSTTSDGGQVTRRYVGTHAMSQMHALGQPVECTINMRLESHTEPFKLVMDTGSHDTYMDIL
ncbi:hypothetical protein DXG03_009324 [Asterophora parasitica]|uniref:Uncharacterized protein n=1 Tax=Asterophora parasitica TaxID=117018 RepID=A0A9P7G4E5_9AGAR|nr:hypothetical protein DXG03_009324 [Asterophora parasitica]